MNIGDKIKKIRTDKKLTQKQLATMASISEASIRKYEASQRFPKKAAIEKIACALQIPVSYLINTDNSFSYELLNEIQKVSRNKFYNDNKGEKDQLLQFLYDGFGMDKDMLSDIFINKSKDLSADIQQKLIIYFHKIDFDSCLNFVKKYDSIMLPEVKKFAYLLIDSTLEILAEARKDEKFKSFKKYLVTAFGDNIKNLSQNDLQSLEKIVNDYLEVALYKIQNYYNNKLE